MSVAEELSKYKLDLVGGRGKENEKHELRTGSFIIIRHRYAMRIWGFSLLLSDAPFTHWIYTSKLFAPSSYIFHTTCFGLIGHHEEHSNASAEVDLEINVEEAKYVLLSRHQNAGQNHDLKIANRSFENVPQFRYLGTTIRDQNLIQK
jgi:hypothetical protein